MEPHSHIRWGMLAERGTGVGVDEEAVQAEGRQSGHEVVPEIVGTGCAYT